MRIRLKKISRLHCIIILILFGIISYVAYQLYQLTTTVREVAYTHAQQALQILSKEVEHVIHRPSSYPNNAWALLKKQFDPYPGEFLILNEHNKIIYYTFENISNQHLSLGQLAEQLYNASFKKLEKIIHSNSHKIQYSYTNGWTPDTIHVFIKPLTNARLIYLLSDKDIPFDHERIYHLQIWLIILLIIFSTVLIYASSLIINLPYKRSVILSAVYTGVCGLGIIILMIIINNYSYSIPFPLTPLTHQSESIRFTEKYDDDINIPTGIYVYSLSMPAANKIFFTGYIWQKYHKNDGLERAIRLPQATRIDFLPSYHYKEGDTEVVGWFVRAELAQQFNYIRYPFEINTITLALEHPDITKKVFLVPDLKSYDRLAPHAIPGVDVALTISGIYFLGSYFGYQPYAPDTNFGLKNITLSHPHERLTFNITIKRGILNSFIMYYLPLLVILIAMFATLCVVEAYRNSTESRAFSSIAAYTALFFSIILIHSSLRNEFKVGEALYIEYLFFLTYIILLLLELHALWTSIHKKTAYRFPYAEIMYWPLTLTAWLLITLYVFF